MNMNFKVKTAEIELLTYDFDLGEEQTMILETRETTAREIKKLVKETAGDKPYKYSVNIKKETYTVDVDKLMKIATKKED